MLDRSVACRSPRTHRVRSFSVVQLVCAVDGCSSELTPSGVLNMAAARRHPTAEGGGGESAGGGGGGEGAVEALRRQLDALQRENAELRQAALECHH